MNDPYDRLESAAANVARRISWEQGNRLGLLWVHALVGVTAGPLMLLWGGPQVIENTLGLWTRPVLAGLALVGGALLAGGLMRNPRSVFLEAAGLGVLAAWDLCMVGGLIAARVMQNDFALRPLGVPLPPGYVVAYPVPVYAGYFGLLAIHLWTLRKIRRAKT